LGSIGIIFVEGEKTMKKMLVLALGVLLVVAFSAPAAMAETKFDFSGHYRVRYNVYNNWNGIPFYGGPTDNSDEEDKNASWDHRFRFDPTFTVSDCLKLRGRIRAYNSNWGTNNGSGTMADLFLKRAWMEIKTKYGMFKIGRMYAGSAGLDPLGYTGSMFISTAHGVFTNIQPFDNTYDGDRIVYALPLGAFTLTAVYEKVTEVDNANTGSQGNYPLSPGYDDDRDKYALVGAYKWATGGASVTGIYTRARNLSSGLAAPENDIELDMFNINPAVIATFGPFSTHAEFMYGWGTRKYDEYATNLNNLAARSDDDLEGWGVYLDGWYNYGPGEVGMLFQYVQGTNWERAGNESFEGVVGYSPGDHYPYVVGDFLVQNHDLTDGALANDTNGDGFLDGGDRNYWSVGVHANHSLSERLMLHAALGYFSLVNTPDNATYNAALNAARGTVGVNYVTEEIDNDLGWEIDLGLNWKIMEGLDFTSMFGYFFGGSAWELGGAVNNTLDVEVGNAYAWRNMLWLSF
jgi:hypothetical protein